MSWEQGILLREIIDFPHLALYVFLQSGVVAYLSTITVYIKLIHLLVHTHLSYYCGQTKSEQMQLHLSETTHPSPQLLATPVCP